MVEKIGSGGFGDVWKAADGLTGTAVAVKVLRPEWLQARKVVKRFRNEYRALQSLRHPNVVEVLDRVEHDDVRAIVMPFLRGGSLYDRTVGSSRRSWLPIPTVAHIGAKLLSVLEIIGVKGIVHRDIKPANILFVDDAFEEPMLSDFGIAHLPDSLLDSSRPTTHPQAIGTLLYMSPEQLNGEDLDCKSDLYSLGMTLYQALTGRLFFNERSLGPIDIQSAICRPSRTPPSAFRNEIPTWLNDLILSMIAFEQHARPDSAKAAHDVITRNQRRSVTDGRP